MRSGRAPADWFSRSSVGLNAKAVWRKLVGCVQSPHVRDPASTDSRARPSGDLGEAFNLVDDGGWVAFNIKETFLDDRDTSGFSVFIKTLILSEYLDIYHMERYRHRLSIDGQPLYYFGVACRKSCPIPLEMLEAM